VRELRDMICGNSSGIFGRRFDSKGGWPRECWCRGDGTLIAARVLAGPPGRMTEGSNRNRALRERQRLPPVPTFGPHGEAPGARSAHLKPCLYAR